MIHSIFTNLKNIFSSIKSEDSGVDSSSVRHERNINIEKLRILAIFFIILHHCVVHGLGLSSLGDGNGKFNVSNCFLIFLNAFIIIGPNIFFFISGYYGINFRFSRIKRLHMLIWFYMSIFAILGLVFKLGNFSAGQIVLAFLLPEALVWFFAAYIMLYFIAPSLNKVLSDLDHNSFATVVLIFTFFNVVFGFIVNSTVYGSGGGYSLIQGIYLYVLGRYFIKYPINSEYSVRITNLKLILLYIVCFALNGFISSILLYFGKAEFSWRIFAYSNPLIILQTICIFFVFININSGKKRSNNIRFLMGMAQTVPVVYLVTDNAFLSKVIYIPMNLAIVKLGTVFTLPVIVFYSVLLLLFASLIENIRKTALKKLCNMSKSQ